MILPFTGSKKYIIIFDTSNSMSMLIISRKKHVHKIRWWFVPFKDYDIGVEDVFQRQVWNLAVTPSGFSGSLFSCHSWLPSPKIIGGYVVRQEKWQNMFLWALHPTLIWCTHTHIYTNTKTHTNHIVSPCFPNQLSCLLPAGGWRDVRGCGLGGHVVRLLLPAWQPGGHHGHQPPGPKWPCAPAASCGEISETLWSFRVTMH